MATEEANLYGGPHDGQVVLVKWGAESITMASLPAFSPMWAANLAEQPSLIFMDAHKYRRHHNGGWFWKGKAE